MGRILYFVILFVVCFYFFRFLAPLLLLFAGIYLGSSLLKSLFSKQPKEEYYEQRVHNPHQNSESDIIDVDYKIVDEE